MPITLGNTSITGITGFQGIGTDSPTEPLHINGPNNGAFIRLENTGGSGVYVGSRNNDLEIYAGNTTRMFIRDSGQQQSTIVGFPSVYNEYKCRAWVNFNGTGTVAIRGSGNISSVVRNSTGRYTVNFANAMPDANYATVMYNNASGGAGDGNFSNAFAGGAGNRTTTSIGVASYQTSAYADSSLFDVVIFR